MKHAGSRIRSRKTSIRLTEQDSGKKFLRSQTHVLRAFRVSECEMNSAFAGGSSFNRPRLLRAVEVETVAQIPNWPRISHCTTSGGCVPSMFSTSSLRRKWSRMGLVLVW